MSAQRMSDRADPPRIDLLAGGEQIDAADMVENAQHRPRGELALVDVKRVVAERRIVGGQHDVSPPGEFRGVTAIRRAPSSQAMFFLPCGEVGCRAMIARTCRPAGRLFGRYNKAGTQSSASARYLISSRTKASVSIRPRIFTSGTGNFARSGNSPITASIPAMICRRRASQSAFVRTGSARPSAARYSVSRAWSIEEAAGVSPLSVAATPAKNIHPMTTVRRFILAPIFCRKAWPLS